MNLRRLINRDRLRSLADPLFWIPFILIVIFKFAIFHYASLNYLLNGFHPIFGMDFAHVEAYGDFTYYYMTFVRLFIQGHLPYTDTLWAPEGIQVYIYTPIFLYITTAFYFIPTDHLFPDIQYTAFLLGRDLDFLRVGFAFVFFDLATIVVMYAAARQLTDNRAIPFAVMLLYALNPITIWWGNYLWLSTPIHVFFLVFGFYFMIQDKLRWAAVWVTIATMIKQTAGLLLPVILFLELRRGKKRAFISFGIMVTVAVIFSMPYLVLYPLDYLSAVTVGFGSHWLGGELPAVTHPVPVSVLAHFLPEFPKYIINMLVYFGIPFGIFLALFWVLSNFLPETPLRNYQGPLVTLALLLSMAMHIFWPRGLYKYYLIALVPFLILFGAILKGPLVSLPPIMNRQCPFIRAPFDNIIIRLQSLLQMIIQRALAILNNVTTWWYLLTILGSVSIFTIHRFFTHFILLGFFLILLFYALYHYSWKKRSNLEPSSEDESQTDA